jgi:succinyl-diaminopimelate desuccinylase
MHALVELTADLIRFRSTAAQPVEIRRCADFVETCLAKSAVPFRRFDYDGVPSILAGPPSANMPVLLMSHIDVVDGPPALFEPLQKDGRLYGRGSIDDKYAVALSLVLLDSHLRRLRARGRGPEDLPLGVLITGDEEIGGQHGAKSVLGSLKCDFCIALDGGAPEKIVVKEKGILHLKLIARGKSAHSSRPWMGDNAIERLIDDYRVLQTFFDPTAVNQWQRTLNFSRVAGGRVINQVPDSAEATFDIRYTDSDDVDRLVAEIRKGVRGQLVVEKREPLFLGGASPYLDRLLELCSCVRTGFEHGASDARFLADHGIAGIVWGADGEKSAHAADEHLIIDSALRLYDVLDRFLEGLKQPNKS